MNFITDTQNTTESVEEKNKITNTDLGQLQVQKGGSLCDTFVQLSVHLQAIAGVYFAQNFHKVIRNADSSLDCLLCPASIFSLPPSVSFSGQLSQAGCSLLPCFVNCFFLSSLRPSFPPPLPHSREISPSGPLYGFLAKTDEEIL